MEPNQASRLYSKLFDSVIEGSGEMVALVKFLLNAKGGLAVIYVMTANVN